MLQYVKRTVLITEGSKNEYGPKLEFKLVDILDDPDGKVDRSRMHEFLKRKTYKPTAGDKIFFIPGCTVPRFKLKDYCTANKVAPVKYRDKATAIFVGPDSTNEMIVHSYYRRVDKSLFYSWLCKVYPLGDPNVLQLKHMIESVIDFDQILLESRIFFELVRDAKWFDIKLPMNPVVSSNPHHNKFDDYVHTYNLFSSIAASDTLKDMCGESSKYFSQDDILSALNNGVVMTEEMYEELRKMIGSTDKDSTKLAMEMMANCDFKESCVYLLLLVKEFGSKFYNSGAVNHVNFKSLLKYFDIKSGGVTLDKVIDALKSKRLCTSINMSKLLPLAMQQMSADADTTYFIVKTVDVTDDLRSEIAKADVENTPAEPEYDHMTLPLHPCEESSSVNLNE